MTGQGHGASRDGADPNPQSTAPILRHPEMGVHTRSAWWPGLDSPREAIKASPQGGWQVGCPVTSTRRAFPGNPQRRAGEAKTHLALTQMHATAICYSEFAISPHGFLGSEAGGGQGREMVEWAEDFQASEFCPPSVGGMKTRSNCVQRRKFAKGHHFCFPCELVYFQERGKKSLPSRRGSDIPPGPAPPDWVFQSGSQTPGDPPAHHPSCPRPLHPFYPRAHRLTSAHCPEIPGKYTNRDSHGNQIKSNYLNS